MWAAALAKVSPRCVVWASNERETKVAPAERAREMGLTGCSMVPIGDDLVLKPVRDVGEYCPLVKP